VSAAGPRPDGGDRTATSLRLEPLALLLIEDSPADSRLLQEHLREPIQRGEVMLQVVRRLSDAVTALRRMKYSCVLVDLGLPDGHGVGSLGALRKADPDVAMIVLTGHDSDDLAQQTMDLGVQDYLVKGRDDAGLLLRRIRFAVQHHRRQARGGGEQADSFVSLSRDPLSGLPSRVLFEDRAACALAQAEAAGAGIAVLAIGIDTLPENADELLLRIAAAIAGGLRNSDTVAMLARGEFAVLLAPTDARFDAVAVARRLDETLRAIDGRDVALLPHIGVACHPRDGLSAVALQEHAERAMFRAQRAGGGVCRYQDEAPAAKPEIWAGTPLERLELRYQPWFDIRREQPVGVEAQWSSDDRAVWCHAGPTPRREAGLAMLGAALTQLQGWRDAGAPVPALAVTVDAILLEEPQLGQFLDCELARCGLEPRALRLLIDADVLTAATPEHLDRLCQLRDRGFGITLDDVLASTDSLGALTAIALDAVRIGGTSQPTATGDRAEGRLRRSVLAVIGVAGSLSLDLIAAGVDDPSDRERLTAAGVRYLQGDALCPPLRGAELLRLWPTARAA